MAVSIWWLLFPISATIISGIVVTIFYIQLNLQSRKIDVPANAPKIDMTFRTQFTDGYCEGLVKSQRKNKNGTWLFEVYPTDGNQEDNKLYPMQYFVVADKYIKRYAKGEKSARRDFIDILPRSELDMPERMRNTLKGEYLGKAGAKAFIEQNIGTSLENAYKTIIAIHKESAMGEMTKEKLETTLEQNKQIIKTFQPQIHQESKDEKKTQA